MKKYLVIGNPIEHSLSPLLHNYWIKENGINAIYEKRELKAKELEPALIEAEYLYADARCLSRNNPICIECIHWLVIKSECGLGMPEGKASGGVWAKDCAFFWEKKI